MAVTPKTVAVFFDKVLETFEEQDMMLDLVKVNSYTPKDLQNSGNVVWKTTRQQRNIQSGWTVTNPTGAIKQEYPCILGTPTNDFFQERLDDLRDTSYWEEAAMQSAERQVSFLNAQIASALSTQASLFYRSNATSGYDFVGEGQAQLNERQKPKNRRSFIINDRDNLKFAKDLAARQTLQGRPDEVWKTGMLGKNIAEFDIYTGSFLPTLVGGADPATTVTGNQSFKPEAGTVSASAGTATNIDYRVATVPVAASASYNIGDKVTIANGGTTVKALGVDDKSDTGQAMTFTIVAKPSGTSISVYPKPIAADDPALTSAELAYANINTRILNLATVNRINTDASKKVNLFFDKDAVEVMAGEINIGLANSILGSNMKPVSMKMKNGLTMYMFYDGNIDDLTFKYRLFCWYGITVVAPDRVGVAVTF